MIDFTLAHSDRVRPLVLSGPVVNRPPFTEHFLMPAEHAFSLVKTVRPSAVAEWSANRYLIAPVKQKARQRPRDLLTANQQDITSPDFSLPIKAALGRLSDVTVPMLILTGTEDIPDVQAHAGAIDAGISGSGRVLLADTGHLLHLEKPDEFSRIVIEFIELTVS